MNKIPPQVSSTITEFWTVIVNTLLLLTLIFGISHPAAASTGYPLIDNLTGAFGDATDFMKSEVDRVFEDSGITAAANQAETALTQLAEGAVPMIDDLSDPYQAKAEEAIGKALEKVQTATNILNKIAGEGAKKTIEFMQNSPLFAGADFGISTPTGRIRVLVKDGQVSLCRTIVGPLGSVIVTGISNAEKLCNFPDERMDNPTKSLLAFTYIAAGHTHIRTTQLIVPNLAEDLTQLEAPVEATTYIKTLGGQYVQIRLAGTDPSAVNLDAKFEVGLKGNGSYYVDIEAEGEAALSITGLKPLVAVEVIRSTSEAMFNKATEIGIDMEVANLAGNAAEILKAGLHHLSDIEENYEDGFGNVSVDVKLTGGIGVGFLDTAISAVSANSTFNLTAPLVSFIEMRAGLLEDFLDVGMGIANVNLNLGTSILEGKQNLFADYKANTLEVVTTFANGVLTELLDMSTKITSIESTFALALLGDADKESTVVYESGLKLPVGIISTNLQTIPNALSKSFEASSYLLLAALDPTAEITDQTWADFENVIVEDIIFTLRAWNPVTASLFGFKEADLLHTIRAIADIRSILIGIVNSSLSESLDDVKTAIDNVVTTAYEMSDDVVIAWLNNATIEKSTALGANGSIGAEAVVELGAKLELKGEVKGSLFLLLLDLPVYVKPDDGLLASTSMPIDLSLDAGASASEGVELTVDAGGTLSFNAFELTVTHWEDKLPTAALMEVAGFSVLEFDDKINQDGSFTGNGYLMLPMGGIVSANFTVDEFGNVTEGTWSGGLELGPLGDFPFIEGTLDNDGLHGTIEVSLLGSNFTANFILNSSGLLLGSYDGDITIAGQELLAANLYLGIDGQFAGHYNGDLSLGGFVASSELDFNNDGFTGSSELTIFGSGLSSTDISISRGGIVSGTYTGQIVAGPHTLSNVTLRAVNGGFIGTAMMDLPGAANVEVQLTIFNGKVTATYNGDFLAGLASQASMDITESDIYLSASLNTSVLSSTTNQVVNNLIGAANTAKTFLLPDISTSLSVVTDLLADAKIAVDTLDAELQKLHDAAYAAPFGPIYIAQKAVNDAQNALDAQWKKYNDSCYSTFLGTVCNELYKIPITGLTFTLEEVAKPALEEAKKALKSAKDALSYTVNTSYNNLYKQWQNLTRILVLDFETVDLLQINSVSFTADLQTMIIGSNVTVSSHMSFMGQSGQISLSLNLGNPADSFLSLANDLLFANVQLNTDNTPPIVISESPTEWHADDTLIKLTATDNAGVASITYKVTPEIHIPELSFPQLTVPGADVYVLIDQEGSYLVTVYATDTSGNVSPTKTISVNIDNQGPQIEVTNNGIQLDEYEILINATDLAGSGIAYLAVSASGAEVLSEKSVESDSTVISLSVPGVTTLSITAVDIAGNTTTITHDVTVPEIPFDPVTGEPVIVDPVTGEPVSGNPSDTEDPSEGGGTLGLLWMLFTLMAIYFRTLSLQRCDSH